MGCRMAPMGPLVTPACGRNRSQQQRCMHRAMRCTAQGGSATEPAQTLAESLRRLDQWLVMAPGEAELSAEQEQQAVALATQLRSSGLCRFGTGKLAPKRDYTLADLRLNKIQPEQLLSPRDVTLEGVRNTLTLGAAAVVAGASYALQPTTEQLLSGGLVVATLAMVDQVGNNGAWNSLVVDTLGRLLNASYAIRVARHEAGHFLTAYLCGVLPRAYTLTSLDAFRRYGAGNVQAGTLFCDAAFRAEVASGKLTASSLDAFTCIALAGVAAEYLAFGQAEGGLDDISTLDGLLRACGFTQKRTDSEVRFAVLSVVLMLRRQAAAHDALAAAMSRGCTVGECIAEIEKHLTAES